MSSELKPKCPICGREMEVVVERRASLVCLCPEHGRFYVCKHCGYATRSARAIAGHARLHGRVEITGSNNEAPPGGAAGSGDTPRKIQLNLDKSRKTPLDFDESSKIPLNSDTPRKIQLDFDEPRKIQLNSDESRKIPLGAGEHREPEAGSALDPEQLADRLLEGKVSIQELSVLTERQLLLVVAALIVKLSRQPRGRATEPTEEQAELPSFVRDNPWLDVLRGRREA
ncbi:hypothetical protein [Infirmifilum sp. SLHALR2]|nr:MAG: hypothetical protein B7L53_06405 [Thermofilum sp. NZ13]